MTEQSAPRMMLGPTRRVAMTLIAVAIAMVSVLWALPASAHRGEQSYLYLDVNVEDLEGRVEFPYTDIREVFGLALTDSPEAIQAELEDNIDELLAYATQHSSVGSGGEWFPMVFDGTVELLNDGVTDDEPGYAIFPFVVEVPTEEVPRNLEVRFDPFFTELPNRDSIVLVANDWQRGIYEAEANELIIFNDPGEIGTLDLGDPSQWLNFTGSVGLGVDHIRTGPDHIFFVLVLLLPSVLVFRSGWRPAESFGTALWRVLKIVSMFTVAHSVTFTLAGLDLIPLPSSKLVETIIAVSIAAAAVHNLRPIFLNREWLLAFGFGLFHGLGFASLVDQLDTSRTAQLVSLVGRNLGIEIGQVVVILVVFPSLFLLRRTRLYRPAFIAGSLALAAVSLVWAVERIVGGDTGLNGLIELVVKWPRSLIAMLVVTAICAGIYYVERQAGRLEPLGDEGYDDAGRELSTSSPSAR